ncbi:MAG TPA: hypothetical protein VGM76_06870, partial [Lacipirellulaceae bacterium]
MYLSDVDLKKLLPSLQIETQNPDHSFEPSSQVQPCSIDMRLDSVFWRQKNRRGPMDLRRSVVDQVDARRYWQRMDVRPNETVTLKPGHMISGRVYEKFTIP